MTQQNKQKKLLRKNAKRKKLIIEQKKKIQLKLHKEYIEDQVENALSYISSKRYDEAKSYLDKLSLKHSDDNLIYYGYGLYYLSMNEVEHGIECLHKSLEIDPKFAYAYVNLAIAYYKKFKLHKMLDTIQFMFDKARFEEDAFKLANQKLLDTEKIIQESYKNLSLKEYCDSQRTFEKAFDFMLNSEFESAISSFSEVIKVTPDNIQSFGNMGICYAKIGDKDNALMYLDMAIKIAPDYELALVNRAIVAQLKPGEKLSGNEINTTEYYKDYSSPEKSYIEDVINHSI